MYINYRAAAEGQTTTKAGATLLGRSIRGRTDNNPTTKRRPNHYSRQEEAQYYIDPATASTATAASEAQVTAASGGCLEERMTAARRGGKDWESVRAVGWACSTEERDARAAIWAARHAVNTRRVKKHRSHLSPPPHPRGKKNWMGNDPVEMSTTWPRTRYNVADSRALLPWKCSARLKRNIAGSLNSAIGSSFSSPQGTQGISLPHRRGRRTGHHVVHVEVERPGGRDREAEHDLARRGLRSEKLRRKLYLQAPPWQEIRSKTIMISTCHTVKIRGEGCKPTMEPSLICESRVNPSALYQQSRTEEHMICSLATWRSSGLGPHGGQGKDVQVSVSDLGAGVRFGRIFGDTTNNTWNPTRVSESDTGAGNPTRNRFPGAALYLPATASSSSPPAPAWLRDDGGEPAADAATRLCAIRTRRVAVSWPPPGSPSSSAGEVMLSVFVEPLVSFLILIVNATKVLEALREIQSNYAAVLQDGAWLPALPMTDLVPGTSCRGQDGALLGMSNVHLLVRDFILKLKHW
nr:unnamed protein product [Digitaria exilis]